MIFLHLPLLDIVAVQRVCRAWNLSIEHSSKAQKVLFLRPYSDVVVEIEPCTQQREGIRDTKASCWRWKPQQGGQLAFRPLFNPFINRYHSLDENRVTLRHEGPVWPYPGWEFDQCERITAQPGSEDGEWPRASIHRMLSIQPRARSITAKCFIKNQLAYKIVNENKDDFVRVEEIALGLWNHFCGCDDDCPLWLDQEDRHYY